MSFYQNHIWPLLKTMVVLGIVTSVFLSCKKNTDELRPFSNQAHASPTLVIQPFIGLPATTTQQVATQLKAMYAGHVVVNPPIPLPSTALNSTRTRYRADSLLLILGRMAPKHQRIIGLTHKDISTTKGKYHDWGVMGLGCCPGVSCVASTYRLKGNNRAQKLFKVAIHELGHTQGLARTTTRHCPVKFCLMRSAEGKDHLDELTSFCANCKPVLVRAGWKFR